MVALSYGIDGETMSRNKQRKLPKKVWQRQPAEVQRSKSGGAVKGPIPKAGGEVGADFEAGIGYRKIMKKRKSKKTSKRGR